MRFSVLCLFSVATFLASQSATPARSENWPHWRGPAWNGSSTETNLPDHWSRSENVAWTTPLPGRSGATPVIWDDSVFLPTPDAEGNLLLLCIDGKTGKIRWQQTVARGNYIKGKNDLASPSAVTDGKRVVVVFGTGDLAAYDFEGKQLWSRNLAKQYGKLAPKWLYGSSPLLYHDKLYLEDLQDAATSVGGSYLLCLDPQTGKELWRQIRKTDARAESQDAYTSPIVRPTGHGAEIVIYGADYLTSHDPDTGAELWRSPSLNARKAQNWRAVASPVVGPEGIFACLPQGFGPLVALRITDTGPGGLVEPGAKAAAAVAWQNADASSDVPSPLYYQGKLFVLNGTRDRLICVDPKAGKTKWSGDLAAGEVFSASPTGADGKIYCLGEEGAVVVLAAGDAFKVVSRFSMQDGGLKPGATPRSGPFLSNLAEGGPLLSTIAVANGHLFVRTPKVLYCIGAKL
jgi:outer membrane protein assembly factor BamB